MASSLPPSGILLRNKDLTLLFRRGEGLCQPEKGVGLERGLGDAQGDPRMDNRYSLGYPRPILQTTATAPLSSGNTHQPAPRISYEAVVHHRQAPLYATGRDRWHRALLRHAGHPYP